MELKAYYQLLSTEQRRALATALSTSVPYLSQLAHGHRRASVAKAKSIEVATGGEVCRHELRPDIFDVPAAVTAPAPYGEDA